MPISILKILNRVECLKILKAAGYANPPNTLIKMLDSRYDELVQVEDDKGFIMIDEIKLAAIEKREYTKKSPVEFVPKNGTYDLVFPGFPKDVALLLKRVSKLKGKALDVFVLEVLSKAIEPVREKLRSEEQVACKKLEEKEAAMMLEVKRKIRAEREAMFEQLVEDSIEDSQD